MSEELVIHPFLEKFPKGLIRCKGEFDSYLMLQRVQMIVLLATVVMILL